MMTVVIALALAASGPKTAVFDLQAAGVRDAEARSAGLVLPTEVRRYAKGPVISGDDIRALLGLERQKQLLGCHEDSSCMAELGGALGVDEVIDGSLGKLGNTFVLELRRLDTRHSRTLASTNRTVKGEADALVDAVRSAVHELYVPAETGSVQVTDTPQPAEAGSSSGRWMVWTGAGVVAVGAAGAIYALTVHSGVVNQQSSGSPTTVTRSQASLASKLWPVSLTVGALGAGLLGVGIYRSTTGSAQVAAGPGLQGGGWVAFSGEFQ